MSLSQTFLRGGIRKESWFAGFQRLRRVSIVTLALPRVKTDGCQSQCRSLPELVLHNPNNMRISRFNCKNISKRTTTDWSRLVRKTCVPALSASRGTAQCRRFERRMERNTRYSSRAARERMLETRHCLEQSDIAYIHQSQSDSSTALGSLVYI